MNKIIYLTLKSLKRRLKLQPTLYIQREFGYSKPTTCSFYKPVTEAELGAFKEETGYSLPKSYVDFLSINNGAILFKDQSEHAEPGWHTFGLDEIVDMMTKAQIYN
ncbi:SMI1/KNR4 family protein [Paenibacillus sp. P26]|nr:SMI1/KNR4 family protein [Paenibacillus sp. P26]UUZ89740.1 SMI1/KNR4 family protein [Paenibacillus sp. P25]